MAAQGNRSGLVRQIGIRPGSDWDGELVKNFNVEVTRERSFREFFGVDKPAEFSSPDVAELVTLKLSEYVFMEQPLSTIRSRYVKTLVRDVIAVTKTHRHEESAVDDLSRTLLQLFEYDGEDRAIRTRTVLDLFMSRGKTQATPDIVVEKLNTAVKLLVQEDKSYEVGNDRNLKGHHPEAQLIAEAIAAYQENVRLHERLGMEEFPDKQLFPGIVMLGTCPTFYLIPVTRALADCVRSGEQPDVITPVRKYVLPNLPANIPDVLLYKEQTFHVAQCLEVFKRFLL